MDEKTYSVTGPKGPGLSVEINEKVRETARAGHDWKNPVWPPTVP